MRAFRDQTVGSKLLTTAMLVSVSAVLLACLTFLITVLYIGRWSYVRDLSALTSVVGQNCQVALTFDLPEDAEKILHTLDARPSVLMAGVYNGAGKLIGQYMRDAARGRDFPAAPPKEPCTFAESMVSVTLPIMLNDENIGAIYVLDDMQNYHMALRSYGLALLLVVLCASAVAYLLSARMRGFIVGPILSLAGTAEKVTREKDYSIRAHKYSNDEIGYLTDAFNGMLEQIGSRDIALKYRSDFEHLVADISSRFVGIASIYLDETIEGALRDMAQFVKADAAHVLRFSDDGATFSMTHEWHNARLPLDRSRMQNLPVPAMPGWLDKLQNEGVVAVGSGDDLPSGDNVERLVVEAQGSVALLDVPMFHMGRLTGVVGFDCAQGRTAWDEDEIALLRFAGQILSSALERQRVADALQGAHDELEQRVEERTAALANAKLRLEAVNNELEAFAYSVSHDLRAPLRGIDGFSQALVEDYGDRLDEEGLHFLSRIRAGAQRMGRLIDDMLAMSRATRGTMKVEVVNLSALAQSVVQELREGAPARNVECVLQAGLTTRADEGMMRTVLDNLLGNAWKFTVGRDPARVEFGLDATQSPPAFYVKDNGAGFDMKYADKLFAPFQRLHKQEEFPGTGVGLATVQRIVLRHGGRVWVTATKDAGATFYFTLAPDA